MLKSFVQSGLRALGLELQRFHPRSSQDAHLRACLSEHRVNLVLDVGANIGQYAKRLRGRTGYRGRIVSFEPMLAAHSALCEAARRDPLWEVAARAAIGAEQGTVTLNVAHNLLSSSLLPMLASHVNAAPESSYSGTESVPLMPLDVLARQYLREDSTVFLKIDTQGYENQVLEGARATLRRAVGVQLELSLVPLYADQQLMPEMIAKMTDSRFDLWGIWPAFADAATGRVLQVDAVFFRKDNDGR
jgi:FkbM family methyltransferase